MDSDVFKRAAKLQEETEALEIKTISALVDLAERNGVSPKKFPIYAMVFAEEVVKLVAQMHMDYIHDHAEDAEEDSEDNITNVEIDL